MVLRPIFLPVEGHVLDASEGEMKLVVSQRLVPGTVLQVRSTRQFVFVEVRSYMPHAGGFQVGVEITDVFSLPDSESLQP